MFGCETSGIFRTWETRTGYLDQDFLMLRRFWSSGHFLGLRNVVKRSKDWATECYRRRWSVPIWSRLNSWKIVGVLNDLLAWSWWLIQSLLNITHHISLYLHLLLHFNMSTRTLVTLNNCWLCSWRNLSSSPQCDNCRGYTTPTINADRIYYNWIVVTVGPEPSHNQQYVSTQDTLNTLGISPIVVRFVDGNVKHIIIQYNRNGEVLYSRSGGSEDGVTIRTWPNSGLISLDDRLDLDGMASKIDLAHIPTF